MNLMKLRQGFFDPRLFTFFGIKLTSWNFSVGLYLLVSIAFVWAGSKAYSTYQVKGR